MYVEKTKSGKYKCVIYVKDFSGKNKKLSVTIDKDTKKNRELALEVLNRRKDEYYNSNAITKIYFHNFLDNEYTEYMKKQKYNTMIQNVRYKNIIKNHSYNVEINKINYKYCYDLIKRISQNFSYNQTIKQIKKILNYAYEIGYIEDVQFLKRFKKIESETKKEILYLEKEQLLSILNYFNKSDTNFSIFLEFLTLTGLRIGEALALTFNDNYSDYLDINKTMIHNTKRINSPKTESSIRKIIKNDRINEILEIQKNRLDKIRLENKNFNKDDLIFFNTLGTPFYYNKLQAKLSKYKEIHLNFHIFRHTHASLLIENGVSVDAIARRLGHADNKITQEIYIHMTKKLKEKEDNIFRNVKII